MSPRRHKDPAPAIVEFFETTPYETARTVLGICNAIVRRRTVTQPGPLREPRKRGKVNDDAGAPLLGAAPVDTHHG